MKSECSSFSQNAWAIWLPFLVILVVSIGIGLSGCDLVTKDRKHGYADQVQIEKVFEDFEPSNFNNSTKIDNEWMPLKPGTRYVYEGTTMEDDGEVVPHRVVINVTDLTKVIGGVRSIVTWDLDYSDGELVEAELAFFAQDDNGTVWRMGEHPEEYDDGQLVASPTWITGIEDAKAGISMKADPKPGTPSYSQGWGPAVGFTDRGQVYQMGLKVRVPFGSYEEVLVIDETSKEEPDAHQFKYWALGVGNIRVGWDGEGEKTREVLELVKIERLSLEALAEVRAEALRLEKHAYEISKDVYGSTLPVERMPQPVASSKNVSESKSEVID